MAATLKDVALRAGVSIRTVSRAINGLDDISAETRQKILLVAKNLGYRPSMLARALVTRRSGTLGLALSHRMVYLRLFSSTIGVGRSRIFRLSTRILCSCLRNTLR